MSNATTTLDYVNSSVSVRGTVVFATTESAVLIVRVVAVDPSAATAASRLT